METVFIVVAVVLAVVLVEAVAYLAYKVFNMSKDLNKTIDNVDGLSECVLEMARRMTDVDVIEKQDIKKSDDFDFPGV